MQINKKDKYSYPKIEYTIYKISILDKIYVGSTIHFEKRKKQHQRDSKKSNTKLYQFIRLNGGWNNAIMDIIEIFTTIIPTLRYEKEKKWSIDLKANLNTAR